MAKKKLIPTWVKVAVVAALFVPFNVKVDKVIDGHLAGGLLRTAGDGDGVHGMIFPTAGSFLIDQTGKGVECCLRVASCNADILGTCNCLILLHNCFLFSLRLTLFLFLSIRQCNYTIITEGLLSFILNALRAIPEICIILPSRKNKHL